MRPCFFYLTSWGSLSCHPDLMFLRIFALVVRGKILRNGYSEWQACASLRARWDDLFLFCWWVGCRWLVFGICSKTPTHPTSEKSIFAAKVACARETGYGDLRYHFFILSSLGFSICHPELLLRRILAPEFLSFRYFLNILSLGSCFQSTKMRNFGVQTV